MLSPTTPSSYQSPKCFVTYGSMGYVNCDQDHGPRKTKPWSSFVAQTAFRTVDLVIPSESYDAIAQKLVHEHVAPIYSKVTMGLGDILEKNFLSHIKQGDILMVSEGKANVDDMFTLKDGILEMYLDKETYERAGLVGRPRGPKGSQTRGSRWVVSYDLRRPSMQHGKNGFDRLVHASQTVFKQPLSWLICDSESISLVIDSWSKRPSSTITCNPEALGLGNTTKVPMEIAQEILSRGDRTSLEMSATDIYEWLSLIRLNSPRVEADDKVDPFVARYHTPEGSLGREGISRIRWSGFISPKWLSGTFTQVLSSCPRHKWFAFMATGFFRSEIGDSAELSVLRPENGENDYLMWEIRQE